MDDTFNVTCTAVWAAGPTFFTVTTGRSGAAVAIVGPNAGNLVNFQVIRNGQPTAQIVITQGTNPFVVGDTFEFDTSFDYSEYRGSLAAPDCIYGAPGRSATAATTTYTFTLE